MAPRRRIVTGIEKVDQVFRMLKQAQRDLIADALNRGLDEMERDARRLVPEDEGDLELTVRQTGLRVTRGGASVTGYVIAGDTKQTANAAYRQEFGRKPGGGGIVDMSKHPGHPPQEFMFPAYWRNRRRALSRIKRAIKAGVKAAARRG